MKKYFIFILLLLLPFIVHAEDLEISNIEYIEKSEFAEILEDASFEGKKININIRFKKLNDFVKYKITIKNNTENNYSIKSSKELSDYVTANFEGIKDTDEVIEANSTKDVYFIVTYDKQVSEEEFARNALKVTTEETTTIELSVKNNAITVEEKNPKTNNAYPIVLTIVLGASIIAIVILTKNKKSLLALFVLTAAIPITIYALEKIDIEVSSKIEIKHPYFSMRENTYLFDAGMTWEEFLASDYNIDHWETTNIMKETHRKLSGEDEETISYDYIPDGKQGVKVGEDSYTCTPFYVHYLINHWVIASENGVETLDKRIIDEKHYLVNEGASC